MVKSTFRSLCRSSKLLAIMPTLTCTSSCKDCGSNSNPKISYKLNLDKVIESIFQAKELNFEVVVFTGGEATLEWETLLKGVKYSSTLGLRSRLVTNAHWAHSLDQTKKCLEELIEHGLDNINFSTGDEHARFVPIKSVLNAIVTAIDLGLEVHVMVEYRSSRVITKDIILDHPLLDSLSKEQRKKVNISESPWMPIDPMTAGFYAPGDTIDDKNVTLREGCPSILQSYIIEADGRIAACCGLGINNIPELYVSNVKEKKFLEKAIKTAENDFLKLWLRSKGPEKILAWASEKDPKIKWHNIYAHKCQACQRVYKDPLVRSVIQSKYQEMTTDVIQSLWFDEVYYSERLKSLVQE